METPEFPVEHTKQREGELSASPEQHQLRCKRVQVPEVGAEQGQGHENLLDYSQILLRHWLALLRFALVGVSGALAISLLQTPTYRARTSLEIQSGNPPDIRASELASSAGSYASPESYVETQAKLLQSESLIEHVVEKLDLHKKRPTTAWGIYTSRVQRLFAWSPTARLPEREQLIRQIERNLTVRVSDRTRVLEVVYESPDPKLAADFANALVSEFIGLTQEERWKVAQSTADWFTSQLDQMKAQLEVSEAVLQNYVRTTGLSFTSGKESLAENRLKQLQVEVSKAQADRIAYEAKFEEAKGKLADSLPEISEDPTMREYRQNLTELQRKYAELSATLTPANYKVQRVEAEISELQTAMQKERANVLGRMRNEYMASLRREKLLSEAHADQQKVVADEASKGIHYDTLRRDVDSNRRLYEVMLQRVKEASLTAAMRDSNVIVIDRAKAPPLPYRPSLPINSAIGLLSGLFLGFAVLCFRQRFDGRISVPGDAPAYLDLPELGVIPLDEEPADSRRDTGQLNLLRLGRTTVAGTARTSANDGGPELATWKRKPSLIAECARTTLTSILLPNREGSPPRVVVLTSPCPGDGKTTVTCNLGIAMTEIGRKVLLIDGDLRRPRLRKVFAVASTSGLSDVLCSNNPLETLPFSQLVCETKIPGLFVLPAGGDGITPTNLFYSPRMPRLLARLRSEFDMILIDAPPMIHLADARVLGCLADGVIFVVRAGQTTTESARLAVERFAEDGTRVFGTVLNSWDPKTAGGYGYGNYGAAYKTYSAE